MPEQPSLLPDREPDLQQQIEELERELATRERVYPRWIEVEKITPQAAEWRLRCVRAAIATLRRAHLFTRVIMLRAGDRAIATDQELMNAGITAEQLARSTLAVAARSERAADTWEFRR